MKKICKFLLIGLMVLGSVISAQAAVVYLNDGSQLQGTVVGATANDIELYASDKTQHINTDRILRIEFTDNEPQFNPSPELSKTLPSTPQNTIPKENIEDLRQVFSVDIGFESPVSNVDFSSTGGGSGRNGGTGVLLGAQYLYYLTPRLGVGFNYEFLDRSATNDLGLVPVANTNVDGSSALMMGVLKYSLVGQGQTRPYLLAGFGANHTFETIDATPLTGFEWDDTHTAETRRLLDGEAWGAASTVRFGLDFHFTEPVIFSIETGWTGIFNKSYNATPLGQDVGLDRVTGSLNAITAGIRLGWRI